MVPVWLHILSLIALGAGGLFALFIAFDETRHPQSMWIMYVVWPVVALFAGPFALWLYFRKSRAQHGDRKPEATAPSTVLAATFHCGAGCTLGDLVSEWLLFLSPSLAVYFGWHSIFADKSFAVWVADFVFAFMLGIAFQYFTIKPMRKLSGREALIAALKADTLSLTAWQVGMYGAMAFARFYLFGAVLHAPLSVDTAEFWFIMQLAMLTGLATSYPVNFWLLKTGVKEAM
jgi:hypothetical protein